MIRYAVERFDDAMIVESMPLLNRHWEELARNKEEIPLNPDYEFYKRANEIGAFVLFTVRDDEKLIGYSAYFVRPHIHYMSAKWAVSDILILMPEYRKGTIGIRMIQFAEQELKAIGVKVMHTTAKIDHPALGMVLKALKHVPIETGYAKRLD